MILVLCGSTSYGSFVTTIVNNLLLMNVIVRVGMIADDQLRKNQYPFIKID